MTSDLKSLIDLKACIEAGDAAGLAALLAAEAALANAELVWGDDGQDQGYPLHYICDLRAAEKLDFRQSEAMTGALVDAGANLDARIGTGDTPLIASARLWAPEVGVRLVAAGADIHAKGLYDTTAVHWAAMLGLKSLVKALIDAGADIHFADTRNKVNALGWAVQGRSSRRFTRGDPLGCVRLLIAAGCAIDPKWVQYPVVAQDAELVKVLTA